MILDLFQIKDPKPWHDELVHWCHGAAGTVPLLARAYLVWRDEKYMAALRSVSALEHHKSPMTSSGRLLTSAGREDC